MPHSHSLVPHHSPPPFQMGWGMDLGGGGSNIHMLRQKQFNRTETERKTTVIMTDKIHKTSEARHNCPPPDD